VIGNTTMWLDLGIDTGAVIAVIATERTALTGSESLKVRHLKVMDPGHDLRTLRRW